MNHRLEVYTAPASNDSASRVDLGPNDSVTVVIAGQVAVRDLLP